jgi:putative CocE/NonD family hydrolase
MLRFITTTKGNCRIMNNLLKQKYVLFSVFIAVTLSSCIAQTQNPDSLYIAQHYTKHEYMIPMRDGVKLCTIVYSPRDTSIEYPILLNRTPYSAGPYGKNTYRPILGPSPLFKYEGYIFVYQDARGLFMSEGTFVEMRPYIKNKKSNKDIDESSDTYDTIDWLIKNVKHNNGKAGIYGISYPGFYAAMGAIDAHPALKAVSPQAPIADWFIDDDFHRNGAFWLPHAFWFYNVFGTPRAGLTDHWPEPIVKTDNPDGYDYFLKMGSFRNTTEKLFDHKIPFWDTLMAHPDYDSFWRARNTLPHFNNIKPAVMVVGGWFDAEDLYGALNTYKSIETKNKNNHNTIVMGPWYHGGWERANGDSLGSISFGSKTSKYYQENIELPFFNYYLKGKGSYNPPEANVFETGSNEWKQFNQWPPKNGRQKNLYFHIDKSLSFEKSNKSKKSFDEYISDPSNPVPYTQQKTKHMLREYMDEDQRFAAERNDVLVYETEPLNKDITFAGPIEANLFVSTSGTDADWVVKLIDVFPDTSKVESMHGYQMMVRGDIMRGKYRNSYTKPEPFVPNKVTKVSFPLQDILHTFKKGHRIMVQIQSSWFPLADRNPQKFENIYFAKDSDFQKSTQRVFYSKAFPSNIKVQVIQ